MSETPVQYRRLPGRGRRGWLVMSARCSLWLAPDHLLALESVGVNEEYKRFYFRDIQSITIEQTRTALLWNCVLGVLAVCIGVLFYAFSESAGPGAGAAFLVTGGIISGLCLLFLIVSFLRGPSCICRIKTAVQTEALTALNRTHAAQKALAIIKPLIEQAQGTLSAGQAVNPVEPVPVSALQPATPRPVVPQPIPAPQAASGNEWRVHIGLFAALVLDALVGFVSHLYPHWRLYFTCSSLLLLGISALSITALVRQRAAMMSDALKSLTVVTFAWNIVVLCGVFVYGFIARITYTITHQGQLPTHIDFYSLYGFPIAALVSDVVELALGVAGLILTSMHISSRTKAGPAPAPEAPSQPLA
jgi:hypothetical protein